MKIALILTYITLSLIISQPCFGQSMPETAFYWENPYYINPASVNFDYAGYFTLGGRKQWTGIKGSPATYFATGAFYAEDYRTQGGIKILKDKIGYIGNLDISLSYAYTLPVQRNSRLNFGISGSYQHQSVDRDEILFIEGNDPTLVYENLRNSNKWNASVGMEYSYARQIKVGIACQNLLSFLHETDNMFEGTNFFYGRYRTRYLGRPLEAGRYRTLSIPRSFDVEAGLCVKQYQKHLQVDGMLSLYINRETQEEKFQLSLFGRSTGEIGALVGLKLMSELKILCTYDYNFNALQNLSRGSFEVMLSFPIHRNRMGNCIYY